MKHHDLIKEDNSPEWFFIFLLAFVLVLVFYKEILHALTPAKNIKHFTNYPELIKIEKKIKNKLTEDLIYASMKNRTDEAMKLVKAGADVNGDILGFKTTLPIHYAAAHGNMKLFKYLVKNNAKMFKRDSLGRNSLHYACLSGNTELINFILQSDNFNRLYLNSGDNEGKTPLHFAAESGNIDAVKLLIRLGANVRAKTKKEETPLHFAAKSGNIALVNLLHDKYLLNFSDKTLMWENVLNYAVKSGNLKLVKMLSEEYGLLDESKKAFLPSIATDAIKTGNIELVNYLLSKRIDIEPSITIGEKSLSTLKMETLLSAAVESNNIEMVRFVFNKYDKEATHKNLMGFSPIDYAVKNGNFEILKFLVENDKKAIGYIKKSNSILVWAIRSGNFDMVKYLIDKGANIYEKFAYGKTPLHIAVEETNLRIVKHLIEDCRANINIKDENGDTPLYYAIFNFKKDSSKVVKYLIEKGADTSFLNKFYFNRIILKLMPENTRTYLLSIKNNLKGQDKAFLNGGKSKHGIFSLKAYPENTFWSSSFALDSRQRLS